MVLCTIVINRGILGTTKFLRGYKYARTSSLIYEACRDSTKVRITLKIRPFFIISRLPVIGLIFTSSLLNCWLWMQWLGQSCLISIDIFIGELFGLPQDLPPLRLLNKDINSLLGARSKIQQTKMLVMCQRFGDLFLFGLVWQYSSIQAKYDKGRFKFMVTYLQQ